MADNVGVYQVSGALMQTPGTVVGTGKLTSEQTLLRNTAAVPSQYNSADNFVSSTIIHSVPPQTSANSIEVNELNAFFSGTEPLEYQRIELALADVPSPVPSTWHLISSGAFSATFDVEMAWKDLYYAKYQGIGLTNPGYNRLNYNVYKHIADINDVYNNVPLTAPSASSGSAPTTPGNILLRLSPYKAKIGTVATVSVSGITITDWQTFVTGAAGYTTTGTFTTAMAANLIYTTAGATASVTGVTFGAATSYDLTLQFSRLSSAPSPGDEVFLHSWVPLVSDVSGAYLNNTTYSPVSINVPVSTTGTIKNIKAWVEFIHDYRVSGSSEVTNAKRGLKNIQVALRSPNTSFETAHPLWNGHLAFPLRTSATLTGVAQQFGNDYYNVPSLLKNSYLLWDGHGVEDGLIDSLTTADIDSAYHEFDRDIDMRTIFWDGAPDKNPRDVSILLGNASGQTPGAPTHPYSWLGTVDGGEFYKSPTWGIVRDVSGALGNYLVPGLNPMADVPVSGAQVPWMLDYRLDLCGLENGRTNLTIPLGSPAPGGWVSGRGGLVPWQYSRNNDHGGLALPPGFGGRVFIRPSTKAMHVMGGNLQIGIGIGSGSWYVNYEVDESAGTFKLDPTNGGLVLNSNQVPIIGPIASPVIDTSLNYYTITTGDPAIGGGSKERILFAGGSSASYVTNALYMGYWATPGSEDITYTFGGLPGATVLPSGVTRHYSTVIDDRLYIAGGEKTGGTAFTGVFTGALDQVTGKVIAWGEHLFPSVGSRNVTRMILMGQDAPSTSSDGGLTFIKTGADSQLVTGSAPAIFISEVVNAAPNQYFAAASNYWATTLDDGKTWWTGSMTGTWQTANAVCYAASGKVYTAGSAIMNATPPTIFGNSINWAKSVDLIPRTTGVPTQITSWAPSDAYTTDDFDFVTTTNPISVTDANSRVTSQIKVSFIDSYSRTRDFSAKFDYRSNGGVWTTLSSTAAATLGDGGVTYFYFDREMPDLPNIEVRMSVSASILPLPHDDNSTTHIQYNDTYSMRAWRPNVSLNSIASGGIAGSGYLVAVGTSTSTVGSWKSNAAMTTWTHSRIGNDGDIFSSVAYGNGVWVAVGSDKAYSNGIAKIMYSSDGTTWTAPYIGYTSPLVSVCFGNGRFVAVTTTRYILTSTDGASWTMITTPMTDNTTFSDVVWNGTRFVATARLRSGPSTSYFYTGVTWYSTDGLTWTMGATNPDGIIYTKLASYVGTEPVNLGTIHWSFFDAIPDQTGTIHKIGWTTFIDNTTGLMSTFRYKMDPASPTWTLVSDAGIVEFVTADTQHYAPVVDDKHRVWVFDATSSKYSQLSWDHATERAIMSPVAITNFGQTQGVLDVSVSMSIAFASGVLFSLNKGDTSQVAATAFVGPAPAADEFNTVGAQLGPASIQPVYSMLNDVVAVKVVDWVDTAAATANNTQYILSSPRVEIVGTRPGLMGTECVGTWNFLFGTKATNFDAVTGYSALNESGIWVRQVRLELLTNLRLSTHEQLMSKNKRFLKSSYVQSKEGLNRTYIQSGSAAWDTGINFIYVNQTPEYGRAIGITSDVNALPDYAVLTFITGNLYDQLVSEGVTDPSHPTWYLAYPGSDVTRPSGTPYIPDSYMVAGTGTAEQVDVSASNDLFNSTVGIQTTVPNANAMIDFLNRQGYTKTMLRRWEETIAAQATGSSSYYFPGLP